MGEVGNEKRRKRRKKKGMWGRWEKEARAVYRGRCKEKKGQKGDGKEEEEMGRESEGKEEGKDKKRTGWGMDGWRVVGRSGEGAWIGWIGSRGQKWGRGVDRRGGERKRRAKKKSALNSVLIGI